MSEPVSPVRFHAPFELREPIAILAYGGWNDGGEAATTAAAHLLETFAAHKLATLSTEEFVDFTVVRPHVRLNDQDERVIRWPDHEFFAIRVETRPFDLIVGLGVEPHLRWRAYCSAVVDVLQRAAVKLVILLGAFLDEVIYSQPIQLVAGSSDPGLSAKLALASSRYEGPTGIVGVLGDALQMSGIPTLALWARLPHYVQAVPNSRAALALLQRVESITGFPVDTTALEKAAATFDQEVSEAIASDPQLAAYVRELKKRAFTG